MITVITVLASLVIGWGVGYYMDWVKKQLKSIKSQLKDKVEVKKPDTNKSFLLDPEDVTKMTMQEHEEMMRRLNDDLS